MGMDATPLPNGGGLALFRLASSHTRQRSRLIFLHWTVEQWATLMQYPTLVTQLGSVRGIFPPCYGRSLLWLVCIAQRTRRTASKEHAVLRCVHGLLPLSLKSQFRVKKRCTSVQPYLIRIRSPR
jgi:hypothetical protein